MAGFFPKATSKDSRFFSTKKLGEGGIRTLDTGLTPYDGLANRCLQPLGHLSKNETDYSRHRNFFHPGLQRRVLVQYANLLLSFAPFGMRKSSDESRTKHV